MNKENKLYKALLLLDKGEVHKGKEILEELTRSQDVAILNDLPFRIKTNTILGEIHFLLGEKSRAKEIFDYVMSTRGEVETDIVDYEYEVVKTYLSKIDAA